MNLKTIKDKTPLVATVIFILALVTAYFLIEPFSDFINETWKVLWSKDRQKISDYFSGFGWWSVIAILILMVLQMFLIIFPSWLPMIVAVMIYGFWPGVLISIAGVLLASTVGFFIGNKLGKSALTKFISEENYEKMNFWIGNYGFWSIVLFRISPFLSNDAISIVAGMLSMSYRKFILATFTGITPLAIAIAYFVNDTKKLKSGMIWIGGAGLVLYGLFIFIDHKKRNKQQ